MSGGLKGVKKVFKKVIKTTKKVLPIALGVAAVVFTAGNAMGALPSWGEAVSNVTGSGSVLQNMLAGAVTQAGYGSVLGMATSAVTGGDLVKGAGYGALTGAATGGVMGAAGQQTDILGDLSPQDSGLGPVTPTGTSPTGVVTGGVPGPVAAPAPPAPGGGGGIMGQGGWLERNGELAGSLIKGVGGGLMEGQAAKDREDADLAIIRERYALNAANYGDAGMGLMDGSDMGYMGGQAGRPGPTDAFNPALYGGEYAYNPATGKIEFVPKG